MKGGNRESKHSKTGVGEKKKKRRNLLAVTKCGMMLSESKCWERKDLMGKKEES